MKFLSFCEKQEKKSITWFLIIASFIFFMLRLPSLFEPYWYGDEGIYEVIGWGLRHGRMLYSTIWDNKPPMLYYIYAIFQGDQFGAKLLSLIFGLASLIVFFFVARKLFGDSPKQHRAICVATGFFGLLFALPLLEGNIANAENFMLLPILLAALLVLQTLFAQNNKSLMSNYKLFIAGLLLGFAFLIKVVAVFDFAAFLVSIIIISWTSIKNIIKHIGSYIVFAAGFIVPLFLTACYFLLRGNLLTFIDSAFRSNVGYVGYGNAFIIPQGLLILKLLLLAVWCGFLLFKRNNLKKTNVFIFAWLGFAIFSALFSQRPYNHYLLMTISSISLFVGLFFLEIKQRVMLSFLGVITALLIFINFPFLLSPGSYGRTVAYYVNYLSFISKRETVTDYYSFFDKNTPRDYAIAQFINLYRIPEQYIYIWGNSGQVYRLTQTLPPGRFIVAYHVTLSKQNTLDTNQAIQKMHPQFIIVYPDQSSIPFSLLMYRPRFYLDGVTIYEKIL